MHPLKACMLIFDPFAYFIRMDCLSVVKLMISQAAPCFIPVYMLLDKVQITDVDELSFRPRNGYV
jgi:hypothetical protein